MSDPPKKVINYQFKADDFWIGIEEGRQLERAARKPRQRKPRLDRTIAQAEKATGKAVTAITLPDGTKLDLGGEPDKTTSDNPWDVAAAELRKGRDGQ